MPLQGKSNSPACHNPFQWWPLSFLIPSPQPSLPQEVYWGGWSMDCSGKIHNTNHSDGYITNPFPSTVPNYYHFQESFTAGSSQDSEDRTYKDTLFRSCRPPDRPWQTSPPQETPAVEGYARLHFPSPSFSSSALQSLSAFPNNTDGGNNYCTSYCWDKEL